MYDLHLSSTISQKARSCAKFLDEHTAVFDNGYEMSLSTWQGDPDYATVYLRNANGAIIAETEPISSALGKWTLQDPFTKANYTLLSKKEPTKFTIYIPDEELNKLEGILHTPVKGNFPTGERLAEYYTKKFDYGLEMSLQVWTSIIDWYDTEEENSSTVKYPFAIVLLYDVDGLIIGVSRRSSSILGSRTVQDPYNKAKYTLIVKAESERK